MHFLATIFSHHYNLQALEGTLCVCRGIEIERPVNSSLWFIIVRFENRLTWTLLSHCSFCRTWEHHPPKGRSMVPLYKSQEGSSVARYPSVLWSTKPVGLLDQPSEQDAEREAQLDHEQPGDEPPEAGVDDLSLNTSTGSFDARTAPGLSKVVRVGHRTDQVCSLQGLDPRNVIIMITTLGCVGRRGLVCLVCAIPGEKGWESSVQKPR